LAGELANPKANGALSVDYDEHQVIIALLLKNALLFVG